VAAFRLVHYVEGVTDFTGEPAADEIFSISDALGVADDGDNTVRVSNVYVDTSTTRPSIIPPVILRPRLDTEVVGKKISGVSYYNGSGDLFDVELETDTDVFSNAYLNNNILTFTTDSLDFPGESDGYGLSVNLNRLVDDGYVAFSDSNVPLFADKAFYLLNQTINDGYSLTPQANSFSTNANITATISDPFGPSSSVNATGILTPSGTLVRLLVNSFDEDRATDTQEWFTDESRRVAATENFPLNNPDGYFTDGGILNLFDSSVVLPAGELQCGGLFTDDSINYPGLVYPQDNYDTDGGALVRPVNSGISPDYSGTTGEAKYKRLFSLGFTTNGGRLRVKSSGTSLVSFDDLDASNASRPVRIRVKVPGPSGTGFMDIGKLFETNKTSDGDGALAGPITGQAGDLIIPFTFGIVSNADTGNMIAVEITYAPGGASLASAKQKIISYVELLAP
jgi:hypothetical protein